MKFSKEGLLTITGLLVIGGVTLMTTTSAKDLKIDLKNAIQHIGSVEFIKKGVEGKVSISATSDGKLNVSGDNLIFTNSSNNSISSSDKSNILGGSSNKIETSTGSTIIAGNTNEIKDAELSVIGGGQRNTVKGNYSVIAGGFGNNIAQDSSYSSILGGAGNALKGNYSSIVGNNNSLIGNNSVIFGSRGNLNANNSFLWSDGKQAKGLNESNVFAVLSENGMVINSNQANSNAQLTIGGSLRIAENVEKDNQVECKDGKGKGILKVMPKNDGSNQKCFCSCNGNSWDSMFGDGRCEGVCKGGLEPICGTTVSSKKVGEDFYMSGSCNQGKVVEGSGSYYVSNNWKNNKSTLHWTCQTDDGQTKACSGAITSYNYKQASECKNLPENAVPNNDKIPTSNMNYKYSTNINLVCSFKCKVGYSWNMSSQKCVPVSPAYSCQGTEPGNATLVAGSDQNLTSNTTRTLYANSTAASGKKCAYLCNAGYTYNSTSKMCVKNVATTYSCQGTEPGNATLVAGSDQNLTANTTRTLYANATAANGKKCAYLCNAGYTYNSTSKMCVKNTYNCQGTVPSNATLVAGSDQNLTSNITRTLYANATAANGKKCAYLCNAGYTYNSTSKTCVKNTYNCQGTVPSNATLVAGSDQNLTSNTTRTLYANAAAANGKKCAYLCNADSEYNSVLKMCIKKSSYCKATHYECESPAVATNKKATSTEYTWDCAIDGTTVSVGCSEVKTESGGGEGGGGGGGGGGTGVPCNPVWMCMGNEAICLGEGMGGDPTCRCSEWTKPDCKKLGGGAVNPWP